MAAQYAYTLLLQLRRIVAPHDMELLAHLLGLAAREAQFKSLEGKAGMKPEVPVKSR